jgi:UDP-glucose 4-epimerase
LGLLGSSTCSAASSCRESVDLISSEEPPRFFIPFYKGNIGDRELVERIASEHEIEACVHFAALAYVGESVAEPERYFENNVEQGIALMGALLKARVRRVVFSSTCATYGEPQEVPISETHPQKPTNPYGWSKLSMEGILAGYDRTAGVRYIALRYFNAAGATERLGELHEPETHLIPNVLFAAQGRIAFVPVFGNDYPTPDGTAIRDYTHVADLGAAHLLALDYLRAGGTSECIIGDRSGLFCAASNRHRSASDRTDYRNQVRAAATRRPR